jgi:hypothetical protein
LGSCFFGAGAAFFGAGAAFFGAGVAAFFALCLALADAFDIINLRNTINSYKKQKPQKGAFEIKKT